VCDVGLAALVMGGPWTAPQSERACVGPTPDTTDCIVHYLARDVHKETRALILSHNALDKLVLTLNREVIREIGGSGSTLNLGCSMTCLSYGLPIRTSGPSPALECR
jgi:hypothetical protein